MNFDIVLSKEQRGEVRNMYQHRSAIQTKSSLEISDRFHYDPLADKNNLRDARITTTCAKISSSALAILPHCLLLFQVRRSKKMK